MSEKRKSKNSSSSKIKLKIPMSSKTEEEDTVNNGETTPNRHSTPIRNQNVNNNIEDSPEMYYRCSPIMGIPCTQQYEVAWNWHSPKEGTTSNEDIRTPKRSAKLQKRRIADSPLMYAPLRVKIKEEKTDVDLFIANFQQFNNPVALQQEQEPVPSTSGNCQENKPITEKNLETSDEGDMRLVYPDDDTAIELVPEKQNCTDFKDLFDDEIDDSMIRCSQQAEEQFLVQADQQHKTENTSSISSNSKENLESHTIGKESSKIPGFHKLIKVPFEQPKEAEKVTIIPDDSFDDVLSQVVDEDFNSAVRNAQSAGSKAKSLQIKPNSFAPKKSLFLSNINNTSIKVGSTRSCSNLEVNRPAAVSVNDRLFSKTKSFDSQRETCRNLGKSVAREFVQENKNKPAPLVTSHNLDKSVARELIQKNESKLESPRKFFKTKSLSEPFSKDPKSSYVPNKNKQPETASTCSTNTQNVRKVIGKSFKCKLYSDSSLNRSTGSGNNTVNGSSQDSFPSLDNKFHNVPLSNLNRSMDRLQAPRTNATPNIQCTAEEIEKKRIEAKMKLEAKRRMLSSKVTNSTRNLPIAQSIKR